MNEITTGKIFYLADIVCLVKGIHQVKTKIIWAKEGATFSLSADDFSEFYRTSLFEGRIVRFEKVIPCQIDETIFNLVSLLVLQGETEMMLLTLGPKIMYELPLQNNLTK